MVGMLVILRPGLKVLSPDAILPLSGALVPFGLRDPHPQGIDDGQRENETFFYTGMVGAIATTMAMPFLLDPHANAADWGWMGLLCATAAISHFLIIKVYQLAEVGVVQPFAYSQFLFAGLMGMMFFAETPNSWTLAGGGLIVAAGIYALLNESRSNGIGKLQHASRTSPS